MSRNWTIRNTNKSDVQSVFSVLLISWLDTYVNDALDITREFILDGQTKMLEYSFFENQCKFEYFQNTKDNLHLVAVDENEIVVGFLHCQRAGGKQFLDGLYLLPEFKGTGLAQEFIRKFDAWEDKYMDTELGVVEYNARAIKFYKNFGFRPNGVKYNFRDKIPCIDMVKTNVKEKRDEV